MSNYLNIIQLVSGIAAIVLIFAGLFLSIRKLNKEDSSEKIPMSTVKLSTILIVLGLLLYAVTKTCTNYANRDQEYDLIVIYVASLIDVIKFFGFIALIPILLNYVKRRATKKVEEDTEKN
ncbi:MAG: hypothetical protein MJ166_07110 [Clostridia bacterium]|nr:hypothetical protein [Clostridia bacterium]